MGNLAGLLGESEEYVDGVLEVAEEERLCPGEKDIAEAVELRHGRERRGAWKTPELRRYNDEWRGVVGSPGVAGEKGEVTSSGL